MGTDRTTASELFDRKKRKKVYKVLFRGNYQSLSEKAVEWLKIKNIL